MEKVYEQLGLFYLGRDVDKHTMKASDALTLLKNKNFTTHAAIIGMTGSGKTGLGVGLIEEAAIDNIPSIIIDPKGDMGNLCLTDPEFAPSSFEPWVADEASAKNEELSSYAKQTAQSWEEGIGAWDQDAERVARFHSVEKTIYTPGSTAGMCINVLGSLEKPPIEIMGQSDIFASYLKSTVTSLLSFIGVEADPLESKEYILIAQIVLKAWTANENLSIENLIGRIVNPPFDKIGVLSLEAFYPQDKRFLLATKFNMLLASPGFAAWIQGSPLDIQSLLYDENGKAKIAIFSIAHLSDNERMFFVTLLLNRYIAWMRRQSGTSALKTVLYMDEIFGFFPPSKNPPSKEPMLLLLKQARAFGVGVILSTQNPVDLDYKGLANIGTWMIGRLQTTQDIDRVIEGLGGQIGSSYTKTEIREILSNLQKRTFFLKSAHLDDIRLFSTRWTLSYLKGPLNQSDISKLMEGKKSSQLAEETPSVLTASESGEYASFVSVDDSVLQYFEMDVSGQNIFVPTLGAKVRIHYFQASKSIDEVQEFFFSLPVEKDDKYLDWERVEQNGEDFSRYAHMPPQEARYAQIPEWIGSDKGLKKAGDLLKEHLYLINAIELYRCKSPKLESKPGEKQGDFIVRIRDILDDGKEQEIEKLKERYAQKEKLATNRLQKAKEQVEKETADSTGSMIETGIAILGALLGKTTPSKIGTAISKGSRVLKERGDVGRAQDRVAEAEAELEQLAQEMEEKIVEIADKYTVENCEIESFSIKPKKSDISIEVIALVWKVG